jgi:hypothetical protein
MHAPRSVFVGLHASGAAVVKMISVLKKRLDNSLGRTEGFNTASLLVHNVVSLMSSSVVIYDRRVS